MAKVNYTKPELMNMLPFYEIVEDCTEGQFAIKAKGEQYLTRDHGVPQKMYDSYKKRAMFLPATERTIDGFVGLLTRKNQTLNGSERFKDFIMNKGIDSSGTSIFDFTKQELVYKFMYGRVGKFVDYLQVQEVRNRAEFENSENRPVASIYNPRSIINWKYKNGKLVLVVLEEVTSEENPDDIFKDIEIKQYRVLKINEEGFYSQDIYRKGSEGYELYDTIDVVVNNERLTSIPFIIENYDGTHPNSVPKPPLLDLCTINISHYNNSADQEASIHIANQATFVLKMKDREVQYDDEGNEVKEKPFVLGSSYVNVIGEEEDFNVVESNGNGLDKLRTIMQDKVNDMAKIGARFLQNDKNVAETFETEYMRRAGEFSMLSSIANSSSESTRRVLEMMQYWKFGSNDDIEFKIHANFNMQSHSTEELTMMLQGVVNGKITLEDFYKALQRNELVDKTNTIEDVKEKLQEDSMV